MIKRASIRLRLIDWLDRIRDQIAKGSMDHLRSGDIHSNSGADADLRGSSLHPCAPERQDDIAVEGPRINEEIWASNRHFDRLCNDPVYIAHAQRLAASNNDFLNHQQISPSNDVRLNNQTYSEVYLGKNRKVES